MKTKNKTPKKVFEIQSTAERTVCVNFEWIQKSGRETKAKQIYKRVWHVANMTSNSR